MKLENEHVLGVQSPPRKSYNPFDSDDEDTDSYANSTINTYDIKSFETTPDSLTFHLDTTDLSWEEAILRHSRMLSNSMAIDASREEELFRKDTELFTDKTITNCEVPESVFSYKDNGFHSVKDIGIDEGVPTHDKVLIKSQDNYDGRTLPDVSLDDNVKGDLPFEDGIKSRPENDVEKDQFARARSEDLVKENGVHEDLDKPNSRLLKVDEFELDLSKEEIESSPDLAKSTNVMVSGKLDPNLGDKDEDYHTVEKTENDVNEVEEFPAKPSIEHEVEANVESIKNQSEEVAPVQPIELPASQEQAGTGSGPTNTLSYNSKVESGSIILDFNAAAEVTDKEKEEETPQTYEAVEKPPESQTMSRDGPSILDCVTDKRVHGETSFSAAMPPPASITYMGPQLHNGNISLRSESSAGSTRSFAFPVLQAEWNSSPVRMAKADQRHFRKERGWVHSLICCKF